MPAERVSMRPQGSTERSRREPDWANCRVKRPDVRHAWGIGSPTPDIASAHRMTSAWRASSTTAFLSYRLRHL
jgi:hypothetical protein